MTSRRLRRGPLGQQTEDTEPLRASCDGSVAWARSCGPTGVDWHLPSVRS